MYCFSARALLSSLQFSALFGIIYGDVTASNAVQTSILSQQAYNLCLFENSIGAQNVSCTSFGVSGMPPVETAVTSDASTATFVASFLSEFGGLGCQSTTVTTTDNQGATTLLSVGELGQVWIKINSTVNIPYPTIAPRPPVITNTGSACGSAPSSTVPFPPSNSTASSSSGPDSQSASSTGLLSTSSSTENGTASQSSSPSSSSNSGSSAPTGSSPPSSNSAPQSSISSSSSTENGTTSQLSSPSSSSSISGSSVPSSSSSLQSSASSSSSPSSSSSSLQSSPLSSSSPSSSSASLQSSASSGSSPSSSSSSLQSSAPPSSSPSSSSTSSPPSPPSGSTLPPTTTGNTDSQSSSISTSTTASGGVGVLPTITTFPTPVSTSSTNTINGVTTNEIYTTRDSSGDTIPVLVFFPCLIFCGGGTGVTLVFGVGPAPGIYFPPGLPPIRIGPDNIPTPDPSASLSQPTQTSNSISTTSGPSSSTSSSNSSCGTRTASTCSTQCVNGGTCTTTCSAVATGCSATCSGTSCSNAATVTFAPWTTGNTNDQNWVAATDFDAAAATSVASGIDALLSSWGLYGGNTTDISTNNSTSLPTSSSSFPTTTFRTQTTSRVSSATGSFISGTSFGPGSYCQGLSPGGGESCVTIPAGCFAVIPSFNVVPQVTCASTRTSFSPTSSPMPASKTQTSAAPSASVTNEPCNTAADCGGCPLAGEVAHCVDGTCSCLTEIS